MSTLADTRPAVTIGDLLLAAEYAEQRERWHQEKCPARADGRECVACLEYEADWLAADNAVRDFLAGVA